jgi:hypothetical protein
VSEIPENSPGPDHGLEDDRPVAKPGRRVRKGERLSEEHRRKVSEGVRRAAERRKAQEAGDGAADNPPKSKPRTAGRPSQAERRAGELRQIREWAGAALAAPAMIGAVAGDPWLTDHFTARGPALADALVREAERNERLRVMLVNIATAAGPAALIVQVALYIGLPLMHFGALPGAPIFGVPVLDRRPPPRPEPGAAPPFIAPERGPAEAPPDRPLSREEWVDATATYMGADPDELAAELAAHENGGGMLPPLPIEPA